MQQQQEEEQATLKLSPKYLKGEEMIAFRNTLNEVMKDKIKLKPNIKITADEYLDKMNENNKTVFYEMKKQFSNLNQEDFQANYNIQINNRKDYIFKNEIIELLENNIQANFYDKFPTDLKEKNKNAYSEFSSIDKNVLSEEQTKKLEQVKQNVLTELYQSKEKMKSLAKNISHKSDVSFALKSKEKIDPYYFKRMNSDADKFVNLIEKAVKQTIEKRIVWAEVNTMQKEGQLKPNMTAEETKQVEQEIKENVAKKLNQSIDLSKTESSEFLISVSKIVGKTIEYHGSKLLKPKEQAGQKNEQPIEQKNQTTERPKQKHKQSL